MMNRIRQMAMSVLVITLISTFHLLPASPKAKAGLGVQSLRPSVRPSVCPSQNLVIATPLKLLIQLSCNLVCR